MKEDNNYSIIRDNQFLQHGVRFFCLGMVILLHLFVRNILGIGSPDIIVLLVNVFAFVMLNPYEALCFYCFLIPFKTGIGMHAITLMYCIIYFLRKLKGKHIFVQKSFFLLIIVVCIELINTLMGSANYAEWLRFSVYVVWLYTAWQVLDDCEWNSAFISSMIKCFLFSFTFAALVVLIVNSKNTSLIEVVSGTTRIGKTSNYSNLNDMLISFHVNDLAVFCTSAVSFALVLIQNKHLKPVIGYALIGFYLFIGMLTQSRMFIVSLISIVVLIIVLQKRGRIKIIIPLILIVLAILYLYQNGFLPVIDEIMRRFKSTDMATGNGRTEIIEIYNNLMLSHPLRTLIGFGVIDYSTYTITEAAHNGTQEMILGIAILRSFCLLSWFIKIIFEAQSFAKKTLFQNGFNYIPLVSLVLSMQFTQFLSQYHMLVLLLLTVVLIGLTDDGIMNK